MKLMRIQFLAVRTSSKDKYLTHTRKRENTMGSSSIYKGQHYLQNAISSTDDAHFSCCYQNQPHLIYPQIEKKDISG